MKHVVVSYATLQEHSSRSKVDWGAYYSLTGLHRRGHQAAAVLAVYDAACRNPRKYPNIQPYLSHLFLVLLVVSVTAERQCLQYWALDSTVWTTIDVILGRTGS